MSRAKTTAGNSWCREEGKSKSLEPLPCRTGMSIFLSGDHFVMPGEIRREQESYVTSGFSLPDLMLCLLCGGVMCSYNIFHIADLGSKELKSMEL